MIKKRNKKQRSISLFVLYIILTMAVYILPYMNFVLPYIPVALLMLASLPVIMVLREKWFGFGLFLAIITLLMLLSNMIVNGVGVTYAINEAVRNLRFFLPVLWGGYILEFCNAKQKKVILIAYVFIVGFVVFKTYMALQEDMWIARLLAQDKTTSSAQINAYRLDNVGGYAFSYLFGVVTLALVHFILKTKNKKEKIVLILVVIFCFYFIIKTMYTTLLVLTSLCTLLLLYLNAKKTKTKFLILFGGLLLLFNIVPLCAFLSRAFGDSLLASKFQQIYFSLTGGGIDELGLRPQLIRTALENWSKTPIFGNHYTNPAHSLFFEILQQNGIVGITLWISLFVSSWKVLYENLKKRNVDTKLFNVSMIYLTVLSIANDTRFTFEIVITVYFMIPLFSTIIYENTNAGSWFRKRFLKRSV